MPINVLRDGHDDPHSEKEDCHFYDNAHSFRRRRQDQFIVIIAGRFISVATLRHLFS